MVGRSSFHNGRFILEPVNLCRPKGYCVGGRPSHLIFLEQPFQLDFSHLRQKGVGYAHHPSAHTQAISEGAYTPLSDLLGEDARSSTLKGAALGLLRQVA